MLLLGDGRFSTTYKYALLLALLDVCLERVGAHGAAPESVTTVELAERVVALYWSHTVAYPGAQRTLRQGGNGQAEIVGAIERFRLRHAADPTEPLWRARLHAPTAFRRLRDEIELKLILMPIPRLQFVGAEESRFLYEYAWDRHVERAEIARYQRTGAGFDNVLRLQPGVSEALVQLNGILRPAIQGQWAAFVARRNDLPDARLSQFLFGPTRASLQPLREPLAALQEGRCFYCDESLGSRRDVDHFIPWARHPDDGIDNLVLTHPACNNAKRDHLAASPHVERWARRSTDERAALAAISAPTHPSPR